MDTFKNRLAKALAMRNMKPVELSQKTGISKALISYYLSGKCLAKQDNIYRIANVLNVHEAWLMGYDIEGDVIQQIVDKCQTLNKEQLEKILDMIDIIK